jgi:hypothetical protein
MGRIHRYGQRKDCLIFNFVATNTIEGRVLQRLLEKLQEIRNALNDDAVFNVVGEVLPAAQIERVLRDYYAGHLGDADLEDRLLPFDVARRFAQPLGIHLDAWEGRCIETEKGIVRLTPVLDRAEQLFGEDGAEAVADRLEKHRVGPIQPTLFPVDDDPPPMPVKGRKRKGAASVSDDSLRKHRGATTLDHVHAAMLLQSSGRANALRALLKSEIERGPDFLRLANALSALYPKDSDEKRLLDAMLLAVPR